MAFAAGVSYTWSTFKRISPVIIPGLTSITFRNLSCAEIAGLARAAGLKSIEWGGDVHVLHGEVAKAVEAARITSGAGLEVSSYGSYYRCGMDEPKLDFGKVLETAVALKAPIIRVWAGKIGSRECLPAQRRAIVEDLRRICALAAEADVKIGLEFHRNTLNDGPAETLKLMEEAASQNIGTYWQPPVGMAGREALDGLRKVLPFLLHIHVFHWAGSPPERLRLEQGQAEWREYFNVARQVPGDRHALIEFVKDNAVESFQSDARVLKKLAGNLQVGGMN